MMELDVLVKDDIFDRLVAAILRFLLYLDQNLHLLRYNDDYNYVSNIKDNFSLASLLLSNKL